jgi:hypothetical protein
MAMTTANGTTPSTFDTREKIALGISAVIVVASIVYWISQVMGALEMLRLAYG